MKNSRWCAGLLRNSGAIVCMMLVALTMICPGAVYAQVAQVQRYESIQKNSSENFTVVTLKKDGVALLREKDRFSGSRRKWELIVLDTTLREKIHRDLEIEQRYTLLGYEHVRGSLFLLYRMGETNKNNLQLVSINLRKDEDPVYYEIKPELDFKLTHFTKAGTRVVLGGYVNNEPAVLLFSMEDNQIKVLPGFFQKDTELVDIRVNQNETFNTILVDRSSRAERKLVFRVFDETGKMLLESTGAIDEKLNLQATMSSTLEREDLLLAGTWGDRNGKQANGFFTFPVDPFSEQKIKYTYFGELTHFLDYLKPKRAERIKENTKEDIKVGKTPDFSVNVMPFKIEERPDGYLLFAEVYNISAINPYYSSPYYNNPYAYSPYGYYNPYWPSYYPGMRIYRPPYGYGNNVKNADQVKTFAGVLLALDPKGNIRWDYSIKLEEIEQPSLEQVSTFAYTGKTVYFMYKFESELRIKKIELPAGEATESVEKIKLDDPVDEVRSDQKEGGIVHWFDNTYYVWGYHTIRNVTKEDRVRDVFYVNKVVVH